jgi:hypothetical protein
LEADTTAEFRSYVESEKFTGKWVTTTFGIRGQGSLEQALGSARLAAMGTA